MSRRSLHILTLAVFLASASGAALRAHEFLGGPDHHQQGCSICQDLLAGSNALLPVAATIPAPETVIAVTATPEAQQPAVLSLPSAIAPRVPPLA